MEAILNLNRVRLSASRRHVTVTMAIDISMSMSNTFRESAFGARKSRLQAAAEGACRVVDSMNNGDHAVVLSFGDEINTVTNGAVELSPQSKAVVKYGINRLRCDGRTKLFDTLIMSATLILQIIGAAKEQGGQGDLGSFWLVLLTDGEDTHSSSSYRDVLEIFRQLSGLPQGVLNIALIGVRLAPHPRNQLMELARVGGSTTKFVDAQNLKQVTDAFDEIAVGVSVQRVQIPVSITSSATPAAQKIKDDSEKWVGGHIGALQHVHIIKGPHSGQIGVARDRQQNGDYIVGTPSSTAVRVAKTDVSIDIEADLIRPGALVKVKSTVSTPSLNWGQFSRDAHGFVREVSETGIVTVEIGANDESKWKAPLNELTVAYDELVDTSLKVGAAVRVPSWKDPSTGWGNLTKNDVGYIRSYDSSSKLYVVDFPSVDSWKGREGDLEVEAKANLVRPGKFVKVRSGISPKGGWGNASPESVGKVVSSRYDGGCVVVSFPDHPAWTAPISELEVVSMDSNHDGTRCDVCGITSFRGPRYKCQGCADFDMCQNCYDGGHHTQHGFCRMDCPDSPPILRPPRDMGSLPTATPTKQFRSDNSTSQSKTASPTSVAAHASVLDATIVDATPVDFTVGQSVTVNGLKGDSDLNNRVGVIARDLGGSKYLVAFAGQEKKVVKSENLDLAVVSPIPLGTFVETTGLSTESENGKFGQVEGYNPQTQRILVKLFDEAERKLSLKKDNLVVIDEAD